MVTKVGDHVLDPGFTDYSKRVLYATYDVASQLQPGQNTIGVIVGNGWYGLPKLLLQCEVTYVDGSEETFYTHSASADPPNAAMERHQWADSDKQRLRWGDLRCSP